MTSWHGGVEANTKSRKVGRSYTYTFGVNNEMIEEADAKVK
jgi:hypothetical protein